jgi:putative tryptophan/tyrosine transport system substrate-binding protein
MTDRLQRRHVGRLRQVGARELVVHNDGLFGLVASLDHLGGNLTGTGAFTLELAGKNVELVRELLPTAKKLAVLCNEADTFTPFFLGKVRSASSDQKFGLDVVTTSPAGIEEAFRRIVSGGAHAVLIQPSLPARLCARLALEARLPAVCPQESFASVGGLLCYSNLVIDQFNRVADYVDRVLRGKKPGELPVQMATRFELWINLKTARELGLTVPPALLARAYEVFE